MTRTVLSAATLVILIFCGGSVHATKPGPSTKSVGEAIQAAREKILAGKRLQAIEILRSAYRDTSPKQQKEVVKAWDEIAQLFLSDRGQNQYSLAESMWLTKPKEAIDALTAVGKTEDGNILIAILGARSALRLRDCSAAEVFVRESETVHPFSAEVRLLRLQLLDCQNGTNVSAPPLKIVAETKADETWTGVDSAVRLLVVKDAFRRRDFKTAHAALTAWEIQAGEDPEVWYWKWSLSPPKSRDLAAARKYLRTCADLTPRRRKNYAMHPELCLATETVESELKSSEKKGS